MREIKFRAWSFHSKRMLYRVIVGNTGTDDPCSSVWSDTCQEWQNFDKHCGAIMQYTSLKDKNGKEIYEGDILSDGEGGIYEIKFDYAAWSFKATESSKYYSAPYPYNNADRMQIIGNIYENPDLIN